jgi:hypothetical protein
MSRFRRQVERDTGIPYGEQLYFNVFNRKNNTSRPNEVSVQTLYILD